MARHWQRVCDLLGPAPEEQEAVALALRARIGLLALAGRLRISDEAFESQLGEVRELARAGSDQESFARALVASAYAAMFRADTRQRALAEEAYRASVELGDTGIQAAAAAVSGLIEFGFGSLTRAERRFDEAERLAAGDPEVGSELIARMSPMGLATALGSTARARLGRPRESLDRALAAAQRAHREQNIATLIPAVSSLVNIEAVLGSSGEALALAEACFDMAETTGAAVARVQARAFLGSGLLQAREFDRAVEVLEPTLELVGTHDATLYFILLTLGEAERGRGRLDRAAGHLEPAMAEARRSGALYGLADVLLAKARLLAEREGAAAVGAIESHIHEARTLTERAEAVSLRGPIAETEALVAELRGDAALRRAKLEEALGHYREIDAEGHVGRLERELAGG
jgi:tetratricopeptide (TPR) repeat protein